MFRELINTRYLYEVMLALIIIDQLTLNAITDRSSDHICELIQNLIINESHGI